MEGTDKSVSGNGGKNEETGAPASSNSLESFVTGCYRKQKEEGKMETSAELSDERTNDFFARAIGESRRMNSEVNKSNQKMDKLHAEFGHDLMNSWQDEHASEVLKPHELELVKQAQYRAPTDPAQN